MNCRRSSVSTTRSCWQQEPIESRSFESEREHWTSRLRRTHFHQNIFFLVEKISTVRNRHSLVRALWLEILVRVKIRFPLRPWIVETGTDSRLPRYYVIDRCEFSSLFWQSPSASSTTARWEQFIDDQISDRLDNDKQFELEKLPSGHKHRIVTIETRKTNVSQWKSEHSQSLPPHSRHLLLRSLFSHKGGKTIMTDKWAEWPALVSFVFLVVEFF